MRPLRAQKLTEVVKNEFFSEFNDTPLVVIDLGRQVALVSTRAGAFWEVKSFFFDVIEILNLLRLLSVSRVHST